jgi:tRNA wybutosine-synthesizing protein 4
MKDRMLSPVDEICVLNVQDYTTSSVLLNRLPNTPRPLLIGVTAADAGDVFVVMGGSAVCFSFGTFWNKGCFTIHAAGGDYDPRSPASVTGAAPTTLWRYTRTVVACSPVESFGGTHPISTANREPVNVSRMRIASIEQFEQLLQAGQPVILEKSDIGACTSKWTNEYLKEKVGIDREVSFLHKMYIYQMSC